MYYNKAVSKFMEKFKKFKKWLVNYKEEIISNFLVVILLIVLIAIPIGGVVWCLVSSL